MTLRAMQKALLANSTEPFPNHKRPLADRIRAAVAFGPVHIVPPPKAQIHNVLPDGTYISNEAMK